MRYHSFTSIIISHRKSIDDERERREKKTHKQPSFASHAHLFLMKCYLFVLFSEICLNLVFIDSNRIEWTQMVDTNHTNIKSRTHTPTKCANRTMKNSVHARKKNTLAIQTDTQPIGTV